MIAATDKARAFVEHHMDSWSLRLDKYSFERQADDEAKTKTLRAIASTSKANYLKIASSDKTHFAEALKRMHGDRCRVVELVQESRMMLHLGRANVLENVGLYAERITGLPMIPGTALKGVLSTWACWEKHYNPSDGTFRTFTDASKLRENMARSIFGDNSSDGSEAGGQIVFVGGYPVSPPKLGLDIVNPHRDQQGNDLARLTPNAFLCLDPGATWRFVFFARAGTKDAKALLDQTQTWLIECLTQTGIGAKTAAGYGRFALPGQPAAAPGIAAAPAAPKSDYANESVFNNRVIAKLDPGRLNTLKSEIETLKKPENEEWRKKLRDALIGKDMKPIRKKLAETGWFPKEWIPN